MGAGVVGPNFTLCDGKDVSRELKKVFGHPHTPKYDTAKLQIAAFDQVAGSGDPVALYDTYVLAGVKPCDVWREYLKSLTGQAIKDIAAARRDGLRKDMAMKISAHDPQHNNDHNVHVSIDLEDDTMTIDSPFTPGP